MTDDVLTGYVLGMNLGGLLLGLPVPVQMGGGWRVLAIVLTVLKVRDEQKAGDYGDPGWYRHPAGTQAKLYQPLLDRIPTWNGTVIREALTSMSQFHVHGQLTRIQVPTLIMVGAKDDVATPAIAKGIQAQIAGSQVVEFQTGHFMMAEDPDRFRTVLGDFLKGLPPSQ